MDTELTIKNIRQIDRAIDKERAKIAKITEGIYALFVQRDALLTLLGPEDLETMRKAEE